MRETSAQIESARIAIREVRTVQDPAVQRLVASAAALSATVGRLARERAWS